MKILVIDQYGNGMIVDAQAVPNIGVQVDMLHKPNPRVKEVVMWPSKETLRDAGAENFEIEALVLVA